MNLGKGLTAISHKSKKGSRMSWSGQGKDMDVWVLAGVTQSVTWNVLVSLFLIKSDRWIVLLYRRLPWPKNDNVQINT